MIASRALAFLRLSLALALSMVATLAGATPSFNSADEWNAVATFHSIGLYWAPAGGGAGVAAQVQFRELGAPSYRQGLDLWYDARNAEYRGSIVELKANTQYDIKLTLSTGYSITLTTCAADISCAKTWNETFTVPAGYTITLGAGVTYIDIMAAAVSTPTSTISGTMQTIRVPQTATDQTYTLLTATAPNNVLDLTSVSTSLPCIDIEPGTHHVIIRGLVFKNCQRSGVRMVRQAGQTPPGPTHHIVVEDNEFFGWGGGTVSAPFMEGALSCGYNQETNDAFRPNQIILQRNKFHDPRYAATPLWGTGTSAPRGMVAASLVQCGTNHVIRYNEVYSSGNLLANGFYGEVPDSPATSGLAASKGFPWADSDIYGNRISGIADVGILAVGANRNVRVWGNYLDQIARGISNTTNAVGPLYVWRNVSNQLAGMKLPSNPDTENRGGFIEGGAGSTALNGGRAYYLHNTVLQPAPLAGFTKDSGAGYGIRRQGGNIYNFVSLNNIWNIHRTDAGYFSISAPFLTTAQQQTITADYDLNYGALDPAALGAANAETHAFAGRPTYSAGFALPSASNGWAGNFALAASSLGYHAATPIANFNDLYATPDVGAHQSGINPMQFGVMPPLLAQLNASPTSGSAALSVTFDPSGSSPAASITSYSLVFGDGTPNGSGAAPQTHSYASAGTYTATLTVSDGSRQASDSRTISVAPSGPSAFELFVSASPGLVVNRTAGERIDFSVLVADQSLPRTLQSVKFYVDGALKATVTASPFQYSWTTSAADAAGNHVVLAEATDTSGNISRESRTVTLLSNPCDIFVSAATVTRGDPLAVQGLCSATQALDQMEFSIDGVLSSLDASSPQTWTVDSASLAAGAHTVAITGRFTAGGSATSSASVQVVAAPLALTLSPGPSVMYDEQITVTATATDGRALKQVDFYVDGAYRSGDVTAPFSYTVMPADYAFRFGRHTLLVQATDTNGNVLTAVRDLYGLTRSCNVFLRTSKYTVGNNDSAGIGVQTIPQGERIIVEGVCSNWMTVQQIEFYLDGALQSTDTAAPYLWTASTGTLALGTHTLAITGRLGGALVSNHSITIEVVAP